MRTATRAHAVRLAAWASALAAAALLLACSNESTPTDLGRLDPPAAPTPVSGLSWSGSWTLDEASPAGDCLVDWISGLQEFFGSYDRAMGMALAVEAGSVNIHFYYPGFNDDEGFWPIEFVGTVDGRGAVRASVAPSRLGSMRFDPWAGDLNDELCYPAWTTVGGELSGTLSADGRSMTGTVVETFRADRDGEVFTIRSHFEATRR